MFLQLYRKIVYIGFYSQNLTAQVSNRQSDLDSRTLTEIIYVRLKG